MRIFSSLRATAMAAAVAWAAGAQAAPVAYTIQFTGADAPTSGSFLYDSLVPSFSNFVVNFKGNSISMTTAANNGPLLMPGSIPTACGISPPSGAAGTFAMLTGALPCDELHWTGMIGPLAGLFEFWARNTNVGDFYVRTTFNSPAQPGPVGGTRYDGLFTVTAAVTQPDTSRVPEPGTAALGLLAVAAMGGMRRRRAR